MPQPISIVHHEDTPWPGVTTVKVTGSIDSDTAPVFEKALETLLQHGHHRLLVDLAAVDYVSSAGIGIFISMLQEARRHAQGDIKGVHASKKLMKVFEAIGLDEMMQFLESLQALPAWSTAPVIQETMDHFNLHAAGELYSGEAFTLRVESRDAADRPVAGYVGKPRLAASPGMAFPPVLENFQAGGWEGPVTVTGTGDVTLTVHDGQFQGTLDLQVHARPKQASFPLTVTCQTCQASMTVPGPDIYRCEQCDETLSVDAWGHAFTLKAGSTAKRRKSRYKGLEMKINADVNYLSVIRQIVSGLCLKEGMDEVTTNAVALAIDEILLNLIEHGNDFDPWQILRIRIEFQKKQLKIQIRDYGEPFDITKNKAMSIRSSVAQGLKRGVGTFLVNQLMDQVKYETHPTYNQLTLIKQYADPAPNE